MANWVIPVIAYAVAWPLPRRPGTRPFSPYWEGPADKATCADDLYWQGFSYIGGRGIPLQISQLCGPNTSWNVLEVNPLVHLFNSGSTQTYL